MSGMKNVVESFVKMCKADWLVPHGYTGNYQVFERLYSRTPDPWGMMHSVFAIQRYLTLLEIVSQTGPHASILDVGCGEGAFTKYLIGCAPEVVGIDVSGTAVERARAHLPRARFECASLEDFRPDRTFGLVIAVEMLYYVQSVDAAIEKLCALGERVIITYTHRDKARLDAHLGRFRVPSRRRFYPFWPGMGSGFTVARFDPPGTTT